MRDRKPDDSGDIRQKMVLHGARYAVESQKCIHASIEVVGSHIAHITSSPYPPLAIPKCRAIDLSGFLILPGLINAHDHLEFALYPRLANPPYRNYIDWGFDIHNTFTDVIARHRAVPKDLRVWWGGIRNLLCGATTVSHHKPFAVRAFERRFPSKSHSGIRLGTFPCSRWRSWRSTFGHA